MSLNGAYHHEIEVPKSSELPPLSKSRANALAKYSDKVYLMSLTEASHEIEVPKFYRVPPLSKSDTNAVAKAPTLGALDRVLYRTISCLPYVGFSFMVYSAGKAIYETKGEPGTVFFVASGFCLVGLLHLCMRELEKTMKDIPSEKKNPLGYAVWFLSVALTILVSGRVPTILATFVLAVFACFIALLNEYFLYLSKESSTRLP